MSNETDPLIQPLNATVGFSRKTKSAGAQYNDTELSLYLPVELPRLADYDGDVEAYYKVVDAAIQQGFTTVKEHIWTQAGIVFEDKDGVLFEKVATAFPGSGEVHVPIVSATPPQVAVSNNTPDPVFGTCKGCGGTTFWDNRSTKKGRQPDGKCRNQACAKGVWLK